MMISLRATVLSVFLALLIPASLVAAKPECFPDEVLPDNAFPSVLLKTSMGDVVIELNRMRAPVTSNNFLRYVLAGTYDQTIFHRVMPGFVVQGGGYTETIEERETFAPIINESGNGLKNLTMTVAMARFDDPHSATNQFYFNVADNASLDPNSRSWGYTVFAEVISGWEVVTSIAEVETGYNELLDASDVPLMPVKILSATVME
jgi:peptidyl-prolyl cis-trans isomerase A (cyclophilin A)